MTKKIREINKMKNKRNIKKEKNKIKKIFFILILLLMMQNIFALKFCLDGGGTNAAGQLVCKFHYDYSVSNDPIFQSEYDIIVIYKVDNKIFIVSADGVEEVFGKQKKIILDDIYTLVHSDKKCITKKNK